MNYYHGSYHKFEEEYISPKNEYTSAESVKNIEELFESVRPKHCIPRIDCVFLVKNEEDIDPAGGYTDYIYLVEAEDVDKSDLAWYSKASCQLEEGDVKGAIESAHKYWSGDVFEILNHSLFEYRTPFAVIIECMEE